MSIRLILIGRPPGANRPMMVVIELHCSYGTALLTLNRIKSLVLASEVSPSIV